MRTRSRRSLLFPIAALLALVATAVRAADAEAGRKKAARCVACHGMDGIAKMPNVPHIAGESEVYLTKQLKAFRSGERQDPQMSIIAKGLSDDDIANLAAWYSSIKVRVELPQQ